jgi:hypothetical protein
MEIGLEINAKKTKYMLMSCHQNAYQNHNIKIYSYLFENAAKLKHLEMTVTNKNYIQEENNEIRGMLVNIRIQIILSFRLLSKYVTIKIYKNIILSVL